MKTLFYWIKVVDTFASDAFDQNSPSEGSRIIRVSLPSIREKNRAHVFWKLLEVYFGKEGVVIPAGVLVPSRFVQSVLKRFRAERRLQEKKGSI